MIYDLYFSTITNGGNNCEENKEDFGIKNLFTKQGIFISNFKCCKKLRIFNSRRQI